MTHRVHAQGIDGPAGHGPLSVGLPFRPKIMVHWDLGVTLRVLLKDPWDGP
ncbi:hypothetical protein MTR_0030s0070 [Medicago truncatula]|uniref:Uncharacterized protein n=1 Tax=Medicago truncatula TaxID=3880 RepID=G7ZUG3_MEDTR|nr:hypothetical protein MTR_0030s0070 [Medicago truncatula]